MYTVAEVITNVTMIPTKAGLWLCSVLYFARSQLISLKNGDVMLDIEYGKSGDLQLILKKGNVTKLEAEIGVGLDLTGISNCEGVENCYLLIDGSRLHVNTHVENGFTLYWISTASNAKFKDCYALKPTSTNWFGGPEIFDQHWPIEKLTLSDWASVLKESHNTAIAEPYWLNSLGAYIFVDELTPLFIDQNSEKSDTVCFSAKRVKPYLQRTRVLLNYTIVATDNAREAHLHAVKHFLNKPIGHPNRKMIERPVWSTWARYKRDINQDVVLEFTKEIVDNGYEDGQLELDDDWEVCYGALKFRQSKFSNITDTVAKIKEKKFRVTLWIHPFVNAKCEEYTSIGVKNNFFVKSTGGNLDTTWWNNNVSDLSDTAKYIDYSNGEAREWFYDRLKLLQDNHGIDSFKFDAGETSWSPQTPSLYGDVEKAPNSITSDYVRTCARFGDLVEVRSAWKTQDLPIFVRMIDKDSVWGTNNGLYTLITTLLQMNINGYTMVLPDMVGGNGYNGRPDSELFIRWLQANTFMPSIQFSYVPWDYKSETKYNVLQISKKFVDLHQKYTDKIIEAMDNSIKYGHPVNAPIWWIDPTDKNALKEDTEFLLGEDILVAPVIEKGAVSRDIYLPAGSWTDGNTGDVYDGPKILQNYSAPIDVLPYFIKRNARNSSGKLEVNIFIIITVFASYSLYIAGR